MNSCPPGVTQQVRPVASSTLTTLTQAGARATTPRAGTIMVQRQKSPVAQQTVRIVQQGQQGTTQVINLGSGCKYYKWS